MDSKTLLHFFFELGQQKYIEHEGWRLIGAHQIESIAEHALRAAQVGYVLAWLEGYKNPQEVCTMVVFHDVSECRIGDIHKVANRYIVVDEEKAAREQLAPLGEIGNEIFRLWAEVESQSSEAGKIAKDADRLEIALTAKEYIEKGYAQAQNWIDNVGKRLETHSAKQLWKDLHSVSSNDWWQGLKKLQKNTSSAAKVGSTSPE